jgi:uncharacterized repeat protein (TIGR01451 family)
VAVLQLRKDGPREAGRYDILTFKLAVTNTGRAAARNVVVEDTLPRGMDFLNSKPSTSGDNPLVWKLGDLAPGASRIVEYQAVAKELGSLKGKAIVRASGGLVREVTTTLRIGEPVLSVRKAGPKQRLVGRSATYIITLTNTGSLAATNVQLVEDLPALDEKKTPSGLVFVGAVPAGRREGNEIRWDLGTLLPGQARTVLVTVQGRREGTFTSVCKATADRGLIEQAKAETRFQAVGSLVAEIDRDRDVLAVGQEVTFTLRVFNGGKGDESNLSAQAVLPAGLALIEVKGAPGNKSVGQTIQFPVLAKLVAGSEIGATIRARAIKPGAQRLAVQVVTESIGADSPVKGDETVTVVGGGAGK